jgi:hypothetical protein
MPEHSPLPTIRPQHPGWTVLAPEKLPALSIWPSALALSVTFLAWGLISSLLITGVGIALFSISLAGWINDIRHERRLH